MSETNEVESATLASS